jgi:hypothetical protein
MAAASLHATAPPAAPDASDSASTKANQDEKAVAAIDQALKAPGLGGEGSNEGTNKLPPVVVTTPSLDPYTLRYQDGTLWLQSSYGATWHPAGVVGAEGVIGIAGAHVGDQILSIEGKAVSALKQREAVRAIFHWPQPVHLVIRSRSGRVHTVECFNE